MHQYFAHARLADDTMTLAPGDEADRRLKARTVWLFTHSLEFAAKMRRFGALVSNENLTSLSYYYGPNNLLAKQTWLLVPVQVD